MNKGGTQRSSWSSNLLVAGCVFFFSKYPFLARMKFIFLTRPVQTPTSFRRKLCSIPYTWDLSLICLEERTLHPLGRSTLKTVDAASATSQSIYCTGTVISKRCSFTSCDFLYFTTASFKDYIYIPCVVPVFFGVDVLLCLKKISLLLLPLCKDPGEEEASRGSN